MKKLISNLAIVSTLFLLAGCQRETLLEEPACSGFQLPQITAYNADAQAKTVLSDDGTKVLWNPGDEIAVFFNGTKSTYYSINTQPKDKAIFVAYDGTSYVKKPSTEPYIYAVYPDIRTNAHINDTLFLVVPSLQHAVKGSFAQDSFISVGRSKDTDMAFYNLCGGICFSVSEPDVKFISIHGNENEFLAGYVGVIFDKDGYPVVSNISSGVKRIELAAPSAEGFEVGEKYYISMLPVCLSNGFTMTFMKDTSKATLTTSTAVSVKRSTFGNLGVADQGLKYEKVSPQAVDLGLSVKWATFNVGSTAPEECGSWFKFGEVKGTPWYNFWEPDKVFPKYEIDTTDYHLLPQYDAAAVNWGAGWRMPSKAEGDELFSGTTRKWVNDYQGTGASGYIFTSNVEGYTDKSIFLPGQEDFSSTDNWEYWTGTSHPQYPYKYAFFMDFYDWYYYTYSRGWIRPVTE